MGDNPLSLAGRTAVVLGGTTGLGHAMSIGLANAGANVVASARRPEHVATTADEIEACGRKTLRVTADVSDSDSLRTLLGACVGEFGKVDILVNSAGTTTKTPSLEMDFSDWEKIIDINLTGTLRSCLVFGEHMIANGWGRIINIASLASYVGLTRWRHTTRPKLVLSG